MSRLFSGLLRRQIQSLNIAIHSEGGARKQLFVYLREAVAKEKTNQEGPGAMKEGRKPKNKSQTWENLQKGAKHDPSCT
jgi:hypothetical protein